MVREKATPKLFSQSLNYFEDAVGWVRRYLNARGYAVAKASLDPYVEVWFFYDYDGGLMLTLDHSSIESIMSYLAHSGGRQTRPPLQQGGIHRVDGLWRLDTGPTRK